MELTMTDPFYVPTPFESLVYYAKTGNIGIVTHLLRDTLPKSELTAEQLVQLAEIRRQLTIWLSIEAEFGMGASLNLKHEKAMAALLRSEGNMAYFAEYIPNAEKYRSVSGAEWIWA
jgi:hypothetical protein